MIVVGRVKLTAFSNDLCTMRKLFFRILVMFAITAAPGVMKAQDAGGNGGQSAGMTKRQQERSQAKKARKEKKDVAREEKRLHKLHMKHQDKATRKRMKQNQRRADKHGQGTHRDPFLKRVFGHKH